MSHETRWSVVVAAPAVRDLDVLPEKVLHAAIELFSALAENPARLGKPLAFELAGLLSARRGPYRVIYELDEERRVVTVVAVGPRFDVYRRR